MSVKVETPPALSGATEQQLKQVYSYLFRLSENLNVALNNLTADSFSSAAVPAGTAAGGRGAESAAVFGNSSGNSFNELRALIVNTAEIVEAEIAVVRRDLDSRYTAISEEWGTFEENIHTTVTETAKATVQNYYQEVIIKDINGAVDNFDAYKRKTEGYIKYGFIDYDENDDPILGIAIGQGLSVIGSTTVDGEKFERFDQSVNCAFYTADKVSFRTNGQEVAYVSQNKLFIHDVEITGGVELNGDWSITTANGLTVRWIGG